MIESAKSWFTGAATIPGILLLGILLVYVGCQSIAEPRRDLYEAGPRGAMLSEKQTRAAGMGPGYIPSRTDLLNVRGVVEAGREQGPQVVKPSPDRTPKETPAVSERFKDIIHTRNDRVYRVEIVREDEQVVIVRVPDGTFAIPRSMITRIEKASTGQAERESQTPVVRVPEK